MAWRSNDPILQTWRDGVRLLKAATGDVSWARFAAIHGNAMPASVCVPHGNWYFLPWHRAYMLMYERAVRQLTGNNDFALPYWDWTAGSADAAGVRRSQTFNGQPNPLFESQREATPTDSLPDSIVGPGGHQPGFCRSRRSRPSVPAARTGRTMSTSHGSIANSAASREHSRATRIINVHNFVGGIMGGVRVRRCDPIFMMHHCNIDRIWWLWNQGGGSDSSDPLWSGMTFQNNFFNPDGTPYSPKVSDLLIPEPLGYTYVDTPIATVSLTGVVAELVVRSNKFTACGPRRRARRQA